MLNVLWLLNTDFPTKVELGQVKRNCPIENDSRFARQDQVNFHHVV